MTSYFRSILWDCLLCVLTSVGLCYTLASGFFSTQAFQTPLGALLMAASSAVMCAALFLVTRNTKSTMIGSLVLIVACLAILGVCLATSTGGSILDDGAGNNVIPGLLFLLTPILVFALSRRRSTALVLIVAGVFLCATVEYLYWYGHVASFVAFLVGAVALFVFRTYQKNLLASESETTAFDSVSIAGLALGLLAVLCAGGLFAAIIAPLAPPHAQVKLITEHYRIQQEEVKGTGNTTSVENLDIYSDKQGSKTEQSSNDDSTQANKRTEGKTSQGNATTQDVTGTQLNMGKDDSKGQGGGGGLGMQLPEWLPYFLIPLVILLVLGAIAVKKLLRRRRHAQMTAGGNALAVQSLYLFFLARLVRMGFPEPGSQTLLDYVQNQNGALCSFERSSGTYEFASLTEVYAQALYGGKPIGDEQLALFEDYYRSFYKRARAYVRTPKYCLLFFLI